MFYKNKLPGNCGVYVIHGFYLYDGVSDDTLNLLNQEVERCFKLHVKLVLCTVKASTENNELLEQAGFTRILTYESVYGSSSGLIGIWTKENPNKSNSQEQDI